MNDSPTVALRLQRHQAAMAKFQVTKAIERPYITDNDEGEIVVTLGRRTLRSWSYGQDTDRRTKMLAAREFVEGWCACRNDVLMTQP